MRRVVRILFNMLTVLSLVLIAAVTLCAVTDLRLNIFPTSPVVGRPRPVLSLSPTVTVGICVPSPPGPYNSTTTSRFGVEFIDGPFIDTRSFRLIDPYAIIGVLHAVSLSWWRACLPLLVPSFAWLAMWYRRKRRRGAGEGLCVSCGYDLRATPERCPECGTFSPRSRMPSPGEA